MNTQTETLRRLRAAAAIARRVGRIPINARVEIGLRTSPVYFKTIDELRTGQAFAPDDDLTEFVPMGEARREDEVRTEGYVAHFYFTDVSDGWDELLNTITVWLGAGEFEPVLVHCP